MKKFKVVAESPTTDIETNVNSYFEALKMFERCKTPSGVFTKAYIMDNETGEFYRTYDVVVESGGVKTIEWAKI